MDYKDYSKTLVDAAGGEDNIISLGHCATRLRFTLKDISKVDDAKAKSVKGILGISKTGNQYQLIAGKEVTNFYDAIMTQYTFSAAEYTGAKNTKWLDLVIDVMGGTMAPLICILIGSAMINAILSIFTNLNLINTAGDTYTFFSTISGTATYALPVLVGFTCAEKLNTDRFLGALIGLVLIYPTLSELIASDAGLSVFGLHIQNFTYNNTVLPAVFGVILLKYVDKVIRRLCPKAVAVFLVPALDMIIVLPIIFLIVGPVASGIANILYIIITWINEHLGFLAVGVTAMTLPFLVMGGMHMALISLITFPFFDTLGYDPILMTAFLCYNIACSGVSLAYGLNSGNIDRKSFGISSCISSLCGVTEPSLFGIVLTDKKCLAATLGSCLISGIVSAVVGYKCLLFVSGSIFSIPAAMSTDYPNNTIACIIVLVVSFVTSFGLGMLLNRKQRN